MPPVSMAGGLLSLAGHPGLPPTTSASAMAAAAAAAAAGSANFHALMQQQQNGIRTSGPLGLPPTSSGLDEKPPISSMEERLKHSASASPHHAPPGPPSLPNRSRTPTSSRSPSSASIGRPASVGAGPPRTSGTPDQEERNAKRIKMEENARKSGHVSRLCLTTLLRRFVSRVSAGLSKHWTSEKQLFDFLSVCAFDNVVVIVHWPGLRRCYVCLLFFSRCVPKIWAENLAKRPDIKTFIIS